MNLIINDPFYKTSIGFDDMFRRLQDLKPYNNSSSVQNYPPYNIIKHTDNVYCVELAVAGFKKEDLKVSVEDGVLIISGTYDSRNGEPDYIHKGIAERAFIRRFTLSDHVKVESSKLVDGILIIWLEKVVPENKKPVSIEIQ